MLIFRNLLDTKINPIAPTSPVITPINDLTLEPCLNITSPKIRVNSGVIEFKTPFKELSIFVCAFINK